MATPRQTRPGGPKASKRTDLAAGVKTRKTKPRTAAAKASETPQEKQRRLLTEQLRRTQTTASRAAFDKACYLRQEDVTGLLLGLHISPPVKVDPRTKVKQLDGRALNSHLRILKELGLSIERMREERADAPDSISIQIDITPQDDPPDVPVYADDAEAGEAAAREGV